MRFGICTPYRQVAALQTHPFDYLEEQVQEFLLPERPEEDFSILHQVGYDQRISIECTWQNLAREVNPAIETVREQWTTSAERTV